MDEEKWITAFELAKRWKLSGIIVDNQWESLTQPALSSLLSCIHNFELLPYDLDGRLIHFFNDNTDGKYFEIFAITEDEIKFKLAHVEKLEEIAPNYIGRHLEEPKDTDDRESKKEILARSKLSLSNINTFALSYVPVGDDGRKYISDKKASFEKKRDTAITELGLANIKKLPKTAMEEAIQYAQKRFNNENPLVFADFKPGADEIIDDICKRYPNVKHDTLRKYVQNKKLSKESKRGPKPAINPINGT